MLSTLDVRDLFGGLIRLDDAYLATEVRMNVISCTSYAGLKMEAQLVYHMRMMLYAGDVQQSHAHSPAAQR